MKYLISAILFIATTPALSQSDDKSLMSVTAEEQLFILQNRASGGQLTGSAGGIGGGCFQGMANATKNAMSNSLEAQTDESNRLLGLAEEYYTQEQECGNRLQEIKNEAANLKAEYENKLRDLPTKIELQQIEYEDAVAAVEQECESTSGSIFQQWKQAQSTGIVTAQMGGLRALIGRQGNINQFQKLFYDNCITSQSNIDRVNRLGRKLAANTRLLQNEIESAANLLNTQTQNLSFNQGQTVKNCLEQKKVMDYKKRVIANTAKSTYTMARTNNFLGLIGGVAQCIGGMSNRQGLNPSTNSTAQ